MRRLAAPCATSVIQGWREGRKRAASREGRILGDAVEQLLDIQRLSKNGVDTRRRDARAELGLMVSGHEQNRHTDALRAQMLGEIEATHLVAQVQVEADADRRLEFVAQIVTR
jgi:hypothetical protein